MGARLAWGLAYLVRIGAAAYLAEIIGNIVLRHHWLPPSGYVYIGAYVASWLVLVALTPARVIRKEEAHAAKSLAGTETRALPPR